MVRNWAVLLPRSSPGVWVHWVQTANDWEAHWGYTSLQVDPNLKGNLPYGHLQEICTTTNCGAMRIFSMLLILVWKGEGHLAVDKLHDPNFRRCAHDSKAERTSRSYCCTFFLCLSLSHTHTQQCAVLAVATGTHAAFH